MRPAVLRGGLEHPQLQPAHHPPQHLKFRFLKEQKPARNTKEWLDTKAANLREPRPEASLDCLGPEPSSDSCWRGTEWP